MVYVEFFKLCRVYRESESSCLAYYNFLKYDKGVIKNCFLLYSNHLRRRRELESYQTAYENLEKVIELSS